jgi:hypothetical protein
MKKGRWIRFLTSVAATSALVILALYPEFFTGSRQGDLEILLYMGLVLLPCFITIFLAAFGRFWCGLASGLWITFLAVMICLDKKASPASVALFLCAVTICAAPFLNLPYRSKRDKGTKAAEQTFERDE